MAGTLKSVRGMHDVLPPDSALWQSLEGTIQGVLSRYGYAEIRMPLVEATELFARSIGEVTDIVEKEMYTFEDRNGDSLSLRPEGTAGCVRAGIQRGILQNRQQRLWYMGPMFRHERPQRGRYRQFHQIGVETFGFEGPDIDAELIIMSARFWRELGLRDVRLEINTLGTPSSRAAYREKLTDYLNRHEDLLDEDARRRLQTNPLRILDTKNPEMKAVVENAPSMLDSQDDESRAHYEGVKSALDAAGVVFVENPKLVRGLDYYNRTVFEWITDALGAQGTICAGGRYDGLVEQLGGRSTPAAGFALGLERLVEMLGEDGHGAVTTPHAYVVMAGAGAEEAGRELAESLRDEVPWLRLVANCGGGGFKAQFKRADRSGASLALVIGEDEAANGSVTLKYLRSGEPQRSVARPELGNTLMEILQEGNG
ncbi:MAG: histidine--tRNA ligase [Pseudomonadota bacterium]|nr:histidine--tRNA ligase [Pseudomonadota bacterium]